jgi:polyisoprenoid-binding protein YceI
VGLIGSLLISLAGCHRKEKRVLRTEPWPAPVALSASGALPSSAPGRPVHYVVESGKVSFELPTRKKKPSGSIGNIAGEIDLDVQHPEATRAELRADLLSLTLSANGRDDAPELLARAFDWLEIAANRSPEERERNRYAKLEITGFDPVAANAEARKDRPALVVARGDLTLHHFRVPVALELEVQLRSGSAAGPSRLSIRTRRPLVVSLVAHDILPRDAQGALLADGVRLLGTEVGRDAHITAEITARAADVGNQNP